MNEQKIIKYNLYKKSVLRSSILFIFLFKLVFNNSLQDLDVHFMKTFELQDENILICTEKGIYLYDKSTGIYIQQKIFSEIIPDNKLNFVTINQFEVGKKLIIVLYENYIYILSEEGIYFTEKKVNFGSQDTYYTLVPYKFEKNNVDNIYHFFYVGYLKAYSGKDPFNIDYFCINNNTRTIDLYSNHSLLIPNYGDISTQKGFSCQIMNSINYGKVLTCFFHVDNELTVASYDINKNLTVIPQLVKKTNEALNPIYINTAISEDKTKSLICYLKEWNRLKCMKYDINDNKLNMIYEDQKPDCNNVRFSTTLMYSSINKDEFIFGCYGNNQNFNLINFNSYFEIENIINFTPNEMNTCECIAFSIAIFINNERSFILACRNIQVKIYNNLPEGIKYAKTRTEENENKTKNSLVKASYIGNTIIFKNGNTNIEINKDNNFSTKIVMESSQLEGYKINKEKDITNAVVGESDDFPIQIIELTELISSKSINTEVNKNNPFSNQIMIKSTEIVFNSSVILPETSSKAENSEYKYPEFNKKISIKDTVNEKIKSGNETKIKEIDEEIKYYDNIIEIVELLLTSGNYDTSILDNGEDDIMEIGKMKIILTTTKNQENTFV